MYITRLSLLIFEKYFQLLIRFDFKSSKFILGLFFIKHQEFLMLKLKIV